MSKTRQSEPLTLIEIMGNLHLKRRLMREDRRCRYCHRRVSNRTASLDHVIPRCKAGPNRDENLVLCCKDCNEAKGGRDPIEWAADILSVASAVGVLT